MALSWRLGVVVAGAGAELGAGVGGLAGPRLRGRGAHSSSSRLQRVVQAPTGRLGPSAWAKRELPSGFGFGSSQRSPAVGVQGLPSCPKFRWVAGLDLPP